jgi:hypothetical protein
LRTVEFKNTLLNALGSDTIGRLGLRPVKFEVKHEIEYPGGPIEHLYFVEEGMASITTTFFDGLRLKLGCSGTNR